MRLGKKNIKWRYTKYSRLYLNNINVFSYSLLIKLSWSIADSLQSSFVYP